MKVRIKFAKTGCLKFIGHLEVMRYFQKAFRRANIDVVYSKGYSPHQETSFAAPLGVGITSEGEYFDAQLNSSDTSEEMIQRLNAVMTEGFEVLEFVKLKEDAQNAMSCVAAADYFVSIREGYEKEKELLAHLKQFYEQTEILIVKKTKRSEKETDIKPMIYKLELRGEKVFLQLATGSVDNVKPELVMQALCKYVGIEYQKMAFMVHRLETYLRIDEQLRPLGFVGEVILCKES